MWYWLFSRIFFLVFKYFFGLKVEGLENLPQKSNFIIVSNHNSFLDPAVFMAAIRNKIYCIALREIYKMSWLGWFLEVTHTLPSGSSSQKAIDMLLKNNNIGLFPEGGVSRDGKLKEFRRGAALLALKTGRPIVPCAIIGTFEALPFGSRIPKRRTLKLKIGKPIFLGREFDHYIEDSLLQEGIFRVRNTIEGMLDAG